MKLLLILRPLGLGTSNLLGLALHAPPCGVVWRLCFWVRRFVFELGVGCFSSDLGRSSGVVVFAGSCACLRVFVAFVSEVVVVARLVAPALRAFLPLRRLRLLRAPAPDTAHCLALLLWPPRACA